MKRKVAIVFFLIVCVILAILLLTQTITIMVSSIIFAIALVLFGSISRGFRGNTDSSKLK